MGERAQEGACHAVRAADMTVEIIIQKLQSWWRDRETMRALSAKSDRDLARIGVLRVDIERAVRHGITSDA